MTKRKNFMGIFISIFGVLGIVLVLIVDKSYLNIPLLLKGEPIFDKWYLARSITLLLSLILFFFSLMNNFKTTIEPIFEKTFLIQKLTAFSTYFLSFSFLVLFIFDPYHFHALSREDYPLEWFSAIFLFISSLIFTFLFFKYLKRTDYSKIIKLSFFLLAFIFFVIGMEEVSWFQRVIDFKTPSSFEKNIQNEFNFHNFYSDLSENIYYIGSFIFLVLLPFIKLFFKKYLTTYFFDLLIPHNFVAILTILAYSYNFNMWNSILTQLTFYISLIVIFSFYLYTRSRIERNILIFTLVFLIIQQIIFLNFPNNYRRLWEITEYKEFFITIGFLCFSLDVLLRLRYLKVKANP